MQISAAKAEEIRSNVKKALTTERVEVFATRRLFDTVPAIFQSASACTNWKVSTAELLAVDPCSVFVIGSACTVVSFNPHKNFKVFDEGKRSDIDIAIISNYHFELGWRTLREIGAGKYNLDTAGQGAVSEHRDSHIFWGMIATDKILSVLPFGKDWIRAAVRIAQQGPMEGRDVKFRLYRDSYSFVAYHLNGLRKLRTQLSGLATP